ncbi:MAG: spinster family MFS transporter [Acidobacteriota bacterium]
MKPTAGATWALFILFAINALNFFDRQILGAVAEPIRREFNLSDGALGALTTAFTLLYAAAGVPLGRWADRGRRTTILAVGVFLWSLLTAASGLARSFWQLFSLRLAVGVGEACCAPAATSLIGDLVPPNRRGRALSTFMLGLPVGVAASYAASGVIARNYGWRYAFYLALVPGLLCAVAALWIGEPQRGATESHDVGTRARGNSAYLQVLSIPTMWWLILSGALHNFSMYALASFLTPFLMRFHGADIQTANFISMVVFGLSGLPGLILGGIVADAAAGRRTGSRLAVGALALFASAPLSFFALGRSRGDSLVFALLMGLACVLMYAYYSTVYPTIQDVIEPARRGTAMALYFFGMYVLGASFGPLGTGLASDYFTAQAARAAGVVASTPQALEPFRAGGLHSAMYVIPVLCLLLAVVLFAASRTAPRDIEKLQAWMRDSGPRT